MQRTGAMEAAANVLPRVFPGMLLLCLAVSGCGNTCYSGFWNGNGSSVTVSNSCPLTKATGTVIVQMTAASAARAASGALLSPPASPRKVQHIFVTIRGIEAHPSMVTGEDSADRQELAPELAAHPMQLDLLAVNGDFRSLGLPASESVPATVPADEYRLLRLRLVPLHPSPDDSLPESNACGNAGWNCMVFANGSVQPLGFGGGAAEFPITLENGTNDVFRVLPDEVVPLSIEFDAASSVFFTVNAEVRFAPVFRAISRNSSAVASTQ